MTDKDELRKHNFDGIQEYDNDLPRWWVWLFIITIIFSVIYPFIYDFGPGEFPSESIDKTMAAYNAEKQGSAASQGGTKVNKETLLKLASDRTVISNGATLYATRCMPCHGDKGQGTIGPNLTDDAWIHGGQIMDIHKVISNGVLDKGMLAWKDQLTADELNSVVAYVWTMYGSNPPNPKAPQGDKVPRE